VSELERKMSLLDPTRLALIQQQIAALPTADEDQVRAIESIDRRKQHKVC
jgi:hypothetical protein